jgi:hypothetical protein
MPPVIADFQWKPDVSNVHNGMIKFTVTDEREVDSARLNIVPVFPPEIPTAAVPPESWLDFPSPTPNVALPSGTAQFSQPVSDLKGGKTYTTNIIANDTAGNQAIRSYDIPYVREFENIGNKSKVLIGAHYLFFQRGGWGYWDKENGTPLLGNYDSGDDIVTARHIDWATGFGIGFLPLIWFGPSSYSTLKIRKVLTHPLISDLTYCIFYDSIQLGPGPFWNVDDPAIRRTLLSDLDYLIQNFFNNPSHLVLNGAHPIYYQGTLGWRGNIGSLTAELREKAAQSGIDLFIIGDSVGYYEPDQSRIRPFDAITQFVNYSLSDPEINVNFEKRMDANYKQWAAAAKASNVVFIPSAVPGYRKPIRPDFLTTPRSQLSFAKQLEIGKEYLDPTLEMLLITTFNDWTENTQVEPSVEDGFKYLQTLRDTLAGS